MKRNTCVSKDKHIIIGYNEEPHFKAKKMLNNAISISSNFTAAVQFLKAFHAHCYHQQNTFPSKIVNSYETARSLKTNSRDKKNLCYGTFLPRIFIWQNPLLLR